jgi:hypothetical protein
MLAARPGTYSLAPGCIARPSRRSGRCTPNPGPATYQTPLPYPLTAHDRTPSTTITRAGPGRGRRGAAALIPIRPQTSRIRRIRIRRFTGKTRRIGYHAVLQRISALGCLPITCAHRYCTFAQPFSDLTPPLSTCASPLIHQMNRLGVVRGRRSGGPSPRIFASSV